MNKPVKKEQGEYFVSVEYHMNEMAKCYHKEMELKKEIAQLRGLRKENEELRQKIKELLNKIR